MRELNILQIVSEVRWIGEDVEELKYICLDNRYFDIVYNAELREFYYTEDEYSIRMTLFDMSNLINDDVKFIPLDS